MKKPILLQRTLGILLLPLLVACLALSSQPAPAQDNGYPVAAQAQDNGYPAAPETYSREELAQMLAPIALYPDALLSQILMASTYPLEVIEADRWVRSNPNLKGDALDSALLQEDWDPSVKAVCHFPSILALMSEKIGQTTDLGNAFLAQEGEVMDVIQELRDKAYAQGNLASNARQKVIVQDQTIVIEPANPQVVYVPYYDPLYIYGPWWYPGYPPYYWGPPGVSLGVGLFYWPAFNFGFDYGSWCYFDWPRHYVFINVHTRPRYVRHDRWLTRPGQWQHVPRHRRGVAYRDRATARRFGQAPSRAADFRRDVRGFPARGMTVRERDFRAGQPTHAERNRTGERSTATNRNVRPPQTVERSQQQRDRAADRARQQRREEQGRQQQQQFEQQRQQQQRVERERQVQPGRQQQQRVQQELQQRRAEQARQQREGTNRARQQQGVEQQWGQRENVIRLRPQQQQQVNQEQRVRDNVFNRVDNGRMERQSSERGRASRQGGQGGRSWGGSGGHRR